MKSFLFVILFVFSFNARAWYCYEVASERNGNVINACGIGEAVDEDSARKVALNNAYKELDLICSHSADCSDKALDITPLRTECKKVEAIFRCHRGITAQITSKPRDITQTQLLQEVFIPKKIIQQDGSNAFQKTSIVDFNSNPQGARVHVDGVEICQTPCTKEIDQGEHKLTFEKEDFELYSEVKQIENGRQNINANLQMRYGYVTILGLPEDAVIKVNNKEISAKDRIRLSPNDHVLTVTSKYFQPWYKQFQIKKGDMLEFKYDAEALLGHVKISATDDKGNPLEASIMVNGKSLSQKTPTAITLNSGKNFITLSNSDFKDLSFELNLLADEKVEVKKELIPNNYKSWGWFLGLGWTKNPLEGFTKVDNYSCCLAIDLGFQKTLTNRLSLKLSYNYIGDTRSNETSYSSATGTPNSTVYKVKESNANFISAALPIYFTKEDRFAWYLAPEIGSVSSNFKYTKYSYSSFGYESIDSDGYSAKLSQKFNGVYYGAEWLDLTKPESAGLYFVFGLRKYSEVTKKNYSFNESLTQKPVAAKVVFINLGWLRAY